MDVVLLVFVMLIAIITAVAMLMDIDIAAGLVPSKVLSRVWGYIGTFIGLTALFLAFLYGRVNFWMPYKLRLMLGRYPARYYSAVERFVMLVVEFVEDAVDDTISVVTLCHMLITLGDTAVHPTKVWGEGKST